MLPHEIIDWPFLNALSCERFCFRPLIYIEIVKVYLNRDNNPAVYASIGTAGTNSHRIIKDFVLKRQWLWKFSCGGRILQLRESEITFLASDTKKEWKRKFYGCAATGMLIDRFNINSKASGLWFKALAELYESLQCQLSIWSNQCEQFALIVNHSKPLTG